MVLDRTVMRDRIKNLIVERILDGTYGPGHRIIEMQVANELGTSQAPVREALRDLEAMRFIETIPYRGARVRLVTDEELLETYPVRAALEELAGTLVAPVLTDELVEALEEQLEGMRASARRGDLHQQLTHDVRFHELIVEASGNTVLFEAWRSLRIEARTLITVVSANHDLGEIAEKHQPILDALRTRDPKVAGAEMRRHIEYYGASLLKG